MPKHEDFGRPKKPPEKTQEIDNEARISEKAEMKRKFNRNQKRITLWDIQVSSLTSLILMNEKYHSQCYVRIVTILFYANSPSYIQRWNLN